MSVFRLASEIRNANPSVKQIVDRLNMVANVTADQVAEVLGHINAYQEWTSEEIIYFFWKYEERLSADNNEDIDEATWKENLGKRIEGKVCRAHLPTEGP